MWCGSGGPPSSSAPLPPPLPQRGLRQRRLAARRAELERSLFLTDVTLRPALLEVRRYCLQVASLKLFAVEAATFSLRDWLEQQETARHAVAAAFGEMFGEVRRLVLYAAAVSLGRYMRELGLDAGGHALLPVLTSSAAPPPIAAAATAAAQLGAPKYHTMFAMPRDLRYTTRAAARTQCRRLLRFVRLADLSLWTALQVCSWFWVALGAGGWGGLKVVQRDDRKFLSLPGCPSEPGVLVLHDASLQHVSDNCRRAAPARKCRRL